MKVFDERALGELGKVAGAVMSFVAAANVAKLAMTCAEISLVEQELAEIMGRDWVLTCLQDGRCVSTIIDIARTTVERYVETTSLKRESVDLNTCLEWAKEYLMRNYKELDKHGVPAILIFFNEDGTANEVRVVAYSHGDIVDEYTICPRWWEL